MVETGTKSGKAAFAASLIAVVIGVSVLAGWFFECEFLKRVSPRFVAMNPAGAVAFMLAGASLALFLWSPRGRDQISRARILMARFCALMVMLIGLARLAAILYGWDVGVDQWLFASKLPDDLRPLNRIAPNAAFNFVLLGSALLFVDLKNRTIRLCVEFLVAVIGFGSLLAVLGYVFGIQSFYRYGGFIPMALHTAITFSVLAGAVFLSHTDSGLLAVFAGDGAGGTMARRLMPAIVLIPALFGWLELRGELAGIYDSAVGNALFALGNILVVTFLVCRHAVELHNKELAHTKAEEALQESEERFSGAFEHAPIGVALVSPDLLWLKVNRAICDLVGYSESELVARKVTEVTHPADLAESLENVRRMIAGEIRSFSMEHRYFHKHGQMVIASLQVSLLRDGLGQPRYFIAHIRDITERKRWRDHLAQSQRMETVGKLAGGVAHEFNGIITIIIGQSEFLLDRLPPGSRPAKSALAIRQAAERAATLTRQLLAYGRKQVLQPEVLDLNSVLADMASTLHLLMGRGADVLTIPGARLKAVKMDLEQVKQVIINLVMNAAEAMPGGGKLTLETANVKLDQESINGFPELKPGSYVMLAISDTGIGMSEEVRTHIFEPFFTTKAVGQGMGLGLSTCDGIIKQSDGFIVVASEPARGSTFKIYLPQVEPQTRIPIQRFDSPDLPSGTETILLVEDAPALREMSATLLGRLGYTVLAASSGVEALSLQQQRHIGHIDLLVTVLVMPQTNGQELAEQVRAYHPHSRMLFTSGSSENAMIHQGVLHQGAAFLQKPFTPSALACKVREVLDRSIDPHLEDAKKTFGFARITDGENTP